MLPRQPRQAPIRQRPNPLASHPALLSTLFGTPQFHIHWSPAQVGYAHELVRHLQQRSPHRSVGRIVVGIVYGIRRWQARPHAGSETSNIMWLPELRPYGRIWIPRPVQAPTFQPQDFAGYNPIDLDPRIQPFVPIFRQDSFAEFMRQRGMNPLAQPLVPATMRRGPNARTDQSTPISHRVLNSRRRVGIQIVLNNMMSARGPSTSPDDDDNETGP